MQVSTLPRIGAAIVLSAGMAFSAGCGDQQVTTESKAPSSAALARRVPTARSIAIQQRVADKRSRHLTGEEVARVKSLRGKWQWVADLHHAAMQEAIHDPSIGGMRKQRALADRCATGTRYLTKYFPAIEARSGQRSSPADRAAIIQRLAAVTGVCSATPAQGSIFAIGSTLRSLTPTASPTAGTVDVDRAGGAFHDYMTALLGDVHEARDLEDAIDIMDTYLATASEDASVSPAALGLIAGAIDLGTSSAVEWDTFARPHEGSMFLWGWLTDIGNWVDNVFASDLNGCTVGMETELFGYAVGGFVGTLAEFYDVSAEWCAGGSLIGSIGAAI